MTSMGLVLGLRFIVYGNGPISDVLSMMCRHDGFDALPDSYWPVRPLPSAIHENLDADTTIVG